MAGTPMVVGYRVDPLTAFWAKRVLITEYISIVNIFAGREVIPERLQDDCTPDQLSADIIRLFADDDARRAQLTAYRQLLPALIGEGNTAGRAAEAVLGLLDPEDTVDLHRNAKGQ